MSQSAAEDALEALARLWREERDSAGDHAADALSKMGVGPMVYVRP